MLVFLVQGLALGIAAASQPGPFQAYLLNRTLRFGWKRTVPAAFAPLISDGPIIILMAVLLTQAPAWLLTGLRIAGGLFLFYLALNAYRSGKASHAVKTIPSSRQSILHAACMNLLNPNPYIFWAAVAGPILLQGWKESPGYGVSFLIGFYGALIGGFVLFSAFCAAAGRLGPRATRWMGLGSALVLFGFGLFMVVHAVAVLAAGFSG